MRGLIDERSIMLQPSIIREFGFERAIILQQMHYHLQSPKSGKIIEGEKWIWNTYGDWADEFTFWEPRTIRKWMAKLEEEKLIVTKQFDKSEWNRRKYYRIDYEVFDARMGASMRHHDDASDGHHDDGSDLPRRDTLKRHHDDASESHQNDGSYKETKTSTKNSPKTTTENTSSPDGDGAAPVENDDCNPQEAPKVARPARTKQTPKKTAPAQRKDADDGEEKTPRWTDEFCDAFSARFRQRWQEWTYQPNGRDFKAFKTIRAAQGARFTLAAFIQAATHYFQSPPSPKHAIWHLLDNFAVYYQGPLNQYNRPMEVRNGTNQSNGSNGNRKSLGERAAESTFAVIANSAAAWPTWPAGDGGQCGPTDQPVIDVGPDAYAFTTRSQADDPDSAMPAA